MDAVVHLARDFERHGLACEDVMETIRPALRY
jgi:hypothetical protein